MTAATWLCSQLEDYLAACKTLGVQAKRSFCAVAASITLDVQLSCCTTRLSRQLNAWTREMVA